MQAQVDLDEPVTATQSLLGGVLVLFATRRDARIVDVESHEARAAELSDAIADLRIGGRLYGARGTRNLGPQRKRVAGAERRGLADEAAGHYRSMDAPAPFSVSSFGSELQLLAAGRGDFIAHIDGPDVDGVGCANGDQ